MKTIIILLLCVCIHFQTCYSQITEKKLFISVSYAQNNPDNRTDGIAEIYTKEIADIISRTPYHKDKEYGIYINYTNAINLKYNYNLGMGFTHNKNDFGAPIVPSHFDDPTTPLFPNRAYLHQDFSFFTGLSGLIIKEGRTAIYYTLRNYTNVFVNKRLKYNFSSNLPNYKRDLFFFNNSELYGGFSLSIQNLELLIEGRIFNLRRKDDGFGQHVNNYLVYNPLKIKTTISYSFLNSKDHIISPDIKNIYLTAAIGISIPDKRLDFLSEKSFEHVNNSIQNNFYLPDFEYTLFASTKVDLSEKNRIEFGLGYTAFVSEFYFPELLGSEAYEGEILWNVDYINKYITNNMLIPLNFDYILLDGKKGKYYLKISNQYSLVLYKFILTKNYNDNFLISSRFNHNRIETNLGIEYEINNYSFYLSVRAFHGKFKDNSFPNNEKAFDMYNPFKMRMMVSYRIR